MALLVAISVHTWKNSVGVTIKQVPQTRPWPYRSAMEDDADLHKLAAIGQVVRASAYMERAMMFAVFTVLGEDGGVALLISGETFSWHAGKLKMLVKRRNGPALAEELAAIKAAETAWDERCRVVHSTWSAGPADERANLLKLGRGGKATRSTMTIQETLAVAQQVADAADALFELFPSAEA